VEEMARRKSSNLAIGGAVTVFAICMGAYPFYEVQKHKEHGELLEKEGPLSGSQIQRGQYINTGSQDIGKDPDWDMKNRKWRGRNIDDRSSR
jgi:hypothetical protein